MAQLRIEPPWDQRLARQAVVPLAATRTRPNTVTTLSLLVGLAGALLYAAGGGAVHLGAALVMLAFWLDHADGELARMTQQTSRFGHYYDLLAGGLVLVGLFVGIGIGLSAGPLGALAKGLGVLAGIAVALIFTLRLELERRQGKAATRQPNLLGFEIEDVMYLIGPITWLDGLQPFLILAAAGAPAYALWVLWECRVLLRPPAEPGR
jgi:phosphatidylglycerophosphate synthase